MKKITQSMTILGIVAAMTTTTFASTIGLSINDKVVKATQAPVMENGTTLVPLRVISENLGATVDWNPQAQEITVVKGTDTIVLKIGSTQATVNGQNQILPQAPKAVNGTTMLPVRFVAENLKCEVKYDQASQTVYVTNSDVAKGVGNEEGSSAAVAVDKNMIKQP